MTVGAAVAVFLAVVLGVQRSHGVPAMSGWLQGTRLLAAAPLIAAAAPQTPKSAPHEVPLPYTLQDKPHPRGYVALRTSATPTIDGRLDEPTWAAAQWSEPFLDIVGPTGPKPWAPARVKMLWDKSALYIGAHLEDSKLFANNTLHDSVVYFDNNFEVFIDPDSDNHLYYEIEINALGVVWDLLLAKPYRNGAPAIMSWETVPPAKPTIQEGPSGWSPMQHAVSIDGDLNSKQGTRSWQVELALPWSLLRQTAGGRRTPPKSGDAWRINFSRVFWTVKWDDKKGKYVKDPPVPEQQPYNFVWSPQWQVQMHQPETWGYLQFEDQDVLSRQPAPAFIPDPTWPARAYLMEVYDAQHKRWRSNGSFSSDLTELGVGQPADPVAVTDVKLEVTEVSFIVSALVPPLANASAGNPCSAPHAVGGGWPAADRPARLYVGSDGRISMAFPGGDGKLAYRPAEGTSRWC